MKGIGDLMKQAQEMQERMQRLQSELAELEVVGESGAGLVRVTMTARHDVRRVDLDPSILQEGADVVGDLVAAAMNDAVRRAERAQQDRMAELTAGMPIPPGLNPFGR